MSYKLLAPVTSVLVPGRAHDVLYDGSLALSQSSVARVETAADYFHEHSQHFAERGGLIRFEGGWAMAAASIEKPAEEFREGRLMRNLAIDLGVLKRYTEEGIESTSTMTNCIDAAPSFKDESELVVVTQLSQADRFIYCLGKVLPRTVITIVEAPGEDDPEIIAEEARLLKQSKLLYGWARGLKTLRFADKAGTFLGNALNFKPGAKYTQQHTA